MLPRHENNPLQIIWGIAQICQWQEARVCGKVVISTQVLALCCPFPCLQSCANLEAVCTRLKHGYIYSVHIALLCLHSMAMLGAPQHEPAHRALCKDGMIVTRRA